MKQYKNFVFCTMIIFFYSFSWTGGTYNLNLIHHIDEITDYNSNSNFGVSDVWGYTDEYGNEKEVSDLLVFGHFVIFRNTFPSSLLCNSYTFWLTVAGG